MNKEEILEIIEEREWEKKNKFWDGVLNLMRGVIIGLFIIGLLWALIGSCK